MKDIIHLKRFRSITSTNLETCSLHPKQSIICCSCFYSARAMYKIIFFKVYCDIIKLLIFCQWTFMLRVLCITLCTRQLRTHKFSFYNISKRPGSPPCLRDWCRTIWWKQGQDKNIWMRTGKEEDVWVWRDWLWKLQTHPRLLIEEKRRSRWRERVPYKSKTKVGNGVVLEAYWSD